MNNNYVCYHLHTELSLLDSCTNFKLYVDKAKELGQTAICFTEHGNCYNWIEKKTYCEENGVKYIHGVECYLTKSLLQIVDGKDEPQAVRDNYHTILIAKNYDGVKEINALLDISTRDDHVYYKPRLTFDEFKHISDNVIKISACLASPLNKLRDESLIQYYDYLEIQPHVNSDDQKEYNQWLHTMSIKYNKPLIAGTDTHSIDKYKAECRSILQKAKGIEFSNEDEFDLTYKSYDELVDMFKRQNSLPMDVILSAINNTNIMAEGIEEFVLDKKFKYAKCYDDDEQVIKERINERYKDKIRRGVIKPDKRYIDNVREEVRVFKKIGMLGFMLFMSDLVSWCWDNGIPIGYCRGSVGGSTVAYLIDIIDVDPVVWNTVFSRFANESREELGDIDIDIAPSQRHLVYEHIIEKFGADYTAYILAIGTISDKGTIDEIGRALAKEWSDNNPDKDKDDNPFSLDAIAKIKEEYDNNPDETKKKYPELFYYFDGLLNTAISQSMHPAGIIVSPVTLPDNYGSFWSDGKRILQINMEECHDVNLNKYDLLGLKNVEIIKDTCALAEIPYPKAHDINWNDDKVWDDMITASAGIFQFEGDYAFKMLQQFKPHSVNDMSKVNASLRPSGASYRDRLLAREFNHNPSELIDNLLEDTYGHLVYQEQVIAFLQQICGLSGSAADNVRRAIGRKQKDRLDAAMPSILEGYCAKSDKPRDIAEAEAKKFLQIIEDASSYMFGFNHSTGYSMIGYTCAYLRYYYTEEFIAAYLNNANNDDDIKDGTALAAIKNVSIYNPTFRHSSADYTVDKDNNAVYKGIASIKYLNRQVAEDLYALRNEHFDSFVDVLDKFTGDARQREILIRLQYFREFGKTQKLLRIAELYEKYKLSGKSKSKQIKKDECKIDPTILAKYCDSESDKMYKFSPNGIHNLLVHIANDIPDINIPLAKQIESEIEYLGYAQTRIPEAESTAVILGIDTKYSPKLSLYDLSTGETFVAKITKQAFQWTPVTKGQIIKYRCEEKPRSYKDENGNWQKDPTKMEKWLAFYGITTMYS